MPTKYQIAKYLNYDWMEILQSFVVQGNDSGNSLTVALQLQSLYLFCEIHQLTLDGLVRTLVAPSAGWHFWLLVKRLSSYEMEVKFHAHIHVDYKMSFFDFVDLHIFPLAPPRGLTVADGLTSVLAPTRNIVITLVTLNFLIWHHYQFKDFIWPNSVSVKLHLLNISMLALSWWAC